MPIYSAEIKIKACEEYLSGNYTQQEICQKYDILYRKDSRSSVIMEWVKIYIANGPTAFTRPKENRSYSAELKRTAVLDYLSGGGSYVDVAIKYNIRSKSQLKRWVLKYNANRELKDYCPNREVYMAEARRKTTIEERKTIVEYCITHNRNYKETASLYDVSYSQVYDWVRKYDVKGEDGLVDKRGHHKTDDELDELERLRRENQRLKRKLEEQDMLVELLKKVKEFERM
ncbi:MAG: helix-turn-helix domain-containing protein [Agathobacter sp.]|nr:helix-turn-helix domain-containing protein [Agathobacter sp.]